jgi:hypothetical protein
VFGNTPDQDKQIAQRVVEYIYWLLFGANSFTRLNFVPRRQSCDEASLARRQPNLAVQQSSEFQKKRIQSVIIKFIDSQSSR